MANRLVAVGKSGPAFEAQLKRDLVALRASSAPIAFRCAASVRPSSDLGGEIMDARKHARDVLLRAAVSAFCEALRCADRGNFLQVRYQLLVSESWAIDAQDWLELRTDGELRRAADG